MAYVRHIQLPNGNSYDIQSGHTIKDSSGNVMNQRAALRFINATVEDDAENDETKITVEGGGTTIVQKPTVSVGSYTYNGSAQGPTITWQGDMASNCVITNATKTDAGTYTLTIALKNTNTMVWQDMTTASLTYEYTISKANQTLTLSKNSVTLDPNTLTDTVTVSGAQTTLSATTSDNTVATASVSGGTVTISNVNENNGSATITLTAESTNNYNSATASISVTASFTTFLDGWLTAGGLNPALYADLNAVFADEAAVRRLFTIHDSVDYLVTNASDPNVATIIANDYCAKWINLRDYALDTLYANNTIKTLMDTADKYFYGEWVITDSTTTPPTWGAKGNVPVMTSNTAPYGEVSASSVNGTGQEAYRAFDGIIATTNDMWSSANLGSQSATASITYKFTNPICAKQIKYKVFNIAPSSYVTLLDYTITIKYSNDGSNWTNAATINVSKDNYMTPSISKFNNSVYALYWRVESTPNYIFNNTQYDVGFAELQFYGRELRVSVPTMTSNTAPYGEASASSVYGTGQEIYKAFDNNEATFFTPNRNNSLSRDYYLKYSFGNKLKPKKIIIITYNWYNATATRQYTFRVEGSADNSEWTPITNYVTDSFDSTVYQNHVFDISNSGLYKYYRIVLDSEQSYQYTNDNTTTAFRIATFQIYGLNYSEYDWDTDNPRHYIYDHGVELEALETQVNVIGQSSYNNIPGIRNNDCLEMDVVGRGTYTLSSFVSPQINVTDYNNVFIRKGKHITGITAAVQSVKTNYTTSPSAYEYNNNNQASYENLEPILYSIDVSSINQNMYLSVFVYNGSNTNHSITGFAQVDEWWLE